MILDDIVANRRLELEADKRRTSLDELRDGAVYAEPRRAFRQALATSGRSIIAEVKKASPSKGVIREDFDPVRIARRYADCGAAAISVLTEQRYFQGQLEFLSAIREATPVPLLRKDFLFDPYQIHEARAWGADAVLLIVSVLDDDMLGSMLALAEALDLAALVEVHDTVEWERARKVGATLIGVNNRNLKTFETTLATTEAVAPLCPDDVLLVSESGIRSVADIERLERVGVGAFLVGESLMRAADPGLELSALLASDAISTAVGG